MILGAHVSISGGIHNAPKRANSINAQTFQIFTHNQIQWKPKNISDEEIKKFFSELEKYKYTDNKLPVIHSSYLINLCSDNIETQKKSFESLKYQFEIAEKIKLKYIILHPGSSKGKNEKEALDTIAIQIIKILSHLHNNNVMLLLENTAGQGNNLGYKFEHLKHIIEIVEKEFPDRIGICFDTCHAFSAGYDLKNEYKKVFDELFSLIELKYLKVFHLNDSKHICGARKDRHERIGKGTLGISVFEKLVNDKRFKDIHGILEVPGGMQAYKEDLEILYKLIK